MDSCDSCNVMEQNTCFDDIKILRLTHLSVIFCQAVLFPFLYHQ